MRRRDGPDEPGFDGGGGLKRLPRGGQSPEKRSTNFAVANDGFRESSGRTAFFWEHTLLSGWTVPWICRVGFAGDGDRDAGFGAIRIEGGNANFGTHLFCAFFVVIVSDTWEVFRGWRRQVVDFVMIFLVISRNRGKCQVFCVNFVL